MSFFTNRRLKSVSSHKKLFLFAIATFVSFGWIQISADCAQAGSDMFNFDKKAPIRIVGGNWRWEYFDDDTMHGSGSGNIRISWGDDLTARADMAYMVRPQNRLTLTGNVEVNSAQGLLKCDMLEYDESTGKARAVGYVTVTYVDPPLRIESNEASYEKHKANDSFIAFNGSVSLLTAQDGSLVCDEIKYYIDKRIISIPAKCSGALPMTFVDDLTNPFYGRNARFTGDMLDVLLAEDGTFSYAVATNVTIETGNAFISAPNLSVASSGNDSENALLNAPESGDVTGWYVTAEEKRAEFSCNRLEIDRVSGVLRLSGRVNLNGEGFEMLTELLNLVYADGAFWVSSDRRTEINIDDLFFEDQSNG